MDKKLSENVGSKLHLYFLAPRGSFFYTNLHKNKVKKLNVQQWRLGIDGNLLEEMEAGVGESLTPSFLK